MENGLLKNSVNIIMPVKQSVVGISGGGKTQLVAKFIQTHLEYNIIVYLSGQKGLIESEWRAAAKSLGIKNNPHHIIEEIINAVYFQLSKVPKALLVLDGATDLENTIKYLSPLNKLNRKNEHYLHVIVTSNYTSWDSMDFDTIPLDIFSEDEAHCYLHVALMKPFSLQPSLALLDKDICASFTKLGQILGYLPLALAQAAAYICEVLKSNGLTAQQAIEKYITYFEQKSEQILSEAIVLGSTYERTVLTTWNITLEYLCSRNEARTALDVAMICSYLTTQIPEEIIKKYFKIDKLEFYSRLRWLTNFSLVQHDQIQQNINIHSMTQLAIRYWLKQQAKPDESKQLISSIQDIYISLEDGFMDIRLDSNIEENIWTSLALTLSDDVMSQSGKNNEELHKRKTFLPAIQHILHSIHIEAAQRFEENAAGQVLQKMSPRRG